MKITESIRYIGVDDHKIDLFEGQFVVPLGMSYNSYAILDEKIAVMDSVDASFGDEWLSNLKREIGGRNPDYLVVQHMEMDHSANIKSFMEAFPSAKIVSSKMAFVMMKSYFGTDFSDRQVVVADGAKLELGKHTLNFIAAPNVHWPEVLFTYDECDKVLFSADGFGKFGANDVEDPEGWACEARRYYFGIVGKFGANVQAVLKKASALDIKIIAPLHGPVLSEDVTSYVALYDTWSSYGVESDGVVIAYTSVYGNTKAVANKLSEILKSKGCQKVVVSDLAREDTYECVEDAFRYGKLVLATT
ncbi:MAG: MBL fold metallo-hydrolase, partial [Treponema sp.]|nr:MBL fold metallo-hydrolase [Treponema sp.]